MRIRSMSFVATVSLALAGCSTNPEKSVQADRATEQSIGDLIAGMSNLHPKCSTDISAVELRKKIYAASGEIIRESDEKLVASFVKNKIAHIITYRLQAGKCATDQTVQE